MGLYPWKCRQRKDNAMNKREYAEFESSVKDFFEKEGIANLSSEGEPSFSHRNCECCRRPLAGDRYHATGYNPTTKEIQEYSVCGDCVYYAEYGQLDDQTMLDIEDSSFSPGKRVRVVEGTEDGEDDWAIGKHGTIRESTDDGYCEVELDGEGPKTFLFGEYQLELDKSVPPKA